MKFMYVIPVLAVSAALGASGVGRSGEQVQQAQSPAAPATPPWLDPAWQADDEVDEGAADDGDPHAGIYVDGDDPHAGVHAGSPASDVPPPGACTRDPDYDPVAAATCDGCDDIGSDPHAGLHGNDDAEDDPHAGLYDEAPHGAAPMAAPPSAPVERSHAPNGKTVAEVFAARNALAQSQVSVRGTVVKLTEGVLGKTYLHLRDGSGTAEAGNDDLTVTTAEAFALGETVEVEGQLAIDQDVGVGYTYPALLADAARVRR